MADKRDKADSQERIKFVKTTGSSITVGRRDRAERIREAIVDLQVAIDGCAGSVA